MSILTDDMIRVRCFFHGMVNPFVDGSTSEGQISYGLSSCGYDIRLASGVKVFKNTYGVEVDPKRFKEPGYAEMMFDNITCDRIIIPAHGYVLGGSLEYFRMPEDVVGECRGKSTYARCGITINVTPLEPGWEGYLTIEIENANPCPAVIYANEGIAQIVFYQLPKRPQKTYKDKGGKYQGQGRVQTAIVR